MSRTINNNNSSRQILAHYSRVIAEALQVMNSTEAELTIGHDIECLHDFRVAVRKLRTASRHICLLDPAALKPNVSKDLAWLSTTTTGVRDLDICLEKLMLMLANQQPDVEKSVKLFRSYLQTLRGDALVKLHTALESSRYVALKSDLAAFAIQHENEKISNEGTNNVCPATSPYLLKMYQRISKGAAAVNSKSSSQALHSLRKSARNFRYLLEFFRFCLPADVVDKTLENLRHLQDQLGAIQDIQVLILLFEQYISEQELEVSELKSTAPGQHKIYKKLLKIQKHQRESVIDQVKNLIAKQQKQLEAHLKPY